MIVHSSDTTWRSRPFSFTRFTPRFLLTIQLLCRALVLLTSCLIASIISASNLNSSSWIFISAHTVVFGLLVSLIQLISILELRPSLPYLPRHLFLLLLHRCISLLWSHLFTTVLHTTLVRRIFWRLSLFSWILRRLILIFRGIAIEDILWCSSMMCSMWVVAPV